ncbi:MAG: DUF4363 family protein [Oscillospiraceae bacterium]
MKRVITAVIFLLLAIAICLTGYAICLSRLNSINDALGKATYVSNFSNEDEVTEISKEIIEEWEKSSVVLYALVIHSDLDNMDNKIKMLLFYSKEKKFYEFAKTCEEIIAISNHIKSSQHATFENIF